MLKKDLFISINAVEEKVIIGQYVNRKIEEVNMLVYL